MGGSVFSFTVSQREFTVLFKLRIDRYKLGNVTKDSTIEYHANLSSDIALLVVTLLRVILQQLSTV